MSTKTISIWVKASERLPDMEKAREPYYRFDGKRSNGFLRKLETGIVIFLEDFEVDAEGDESYAIVYDLSRVEWLDEVEVKDEVIKITCEDLYYPAECENCGWFGSSGECGGGHAIADTGDYSDPVCPVCYSNKIESTNDEVPINSLVERLCLCQKQLTGCIESFDKERFENYHLQSQLQELEKAYREALKN